ncbi:hypothetical protein HNR23_000123 [Nocardiopsis mwathae]|uniref:Uncharacterized protein n=1 Tax=Nocardiopsis mwathae TaxID=1472723 RepID=A0A7W9YDA7_9ACTN|nr:hypothetical protein [Nocardiopsis mwathae]MBB6170063.1 hypothetical protein [Nocardiopsis mwathae]
MIRPRITATTDPAAVHPGLAEHQNDMIRRCPYLRPSVDRGLTVWSAYDAETGDQPELFALLVESAEGLRAARRESGPLACRNIAILGPEDSDSARKLLQWPAWLARNLYAPVQLMVGRFWTGVELVDSKGQAMMPPPVAFFSLRNAIPSKDGLFLAEKLPDIMAILEQGPGDDGRDVFTEPLGQPVDDPASVYTELKALFPPPSLATTR